MSIHVTHWSKIVVAVVALIMCGTALAANDVKSSLFQDVDSSFEQAKKVRANVLAPASYSRAVKSYRSAEKRYSSGGDLGKIEDLLKDALGHLNQSLKSTEIAQIKLATAFDAREDASAVEAIDNAKSSWDKGERYFSKAAVNLEEGDAKLIPDLARKAEEAYRESELISIKAKFLNGTRDLLEQAEAKKVKRYAPVTLQRAKELLAEAEVSLEQDRYDRDKPRNLAREAKYTAQHALFISERLLSVKKGALSQEQLYLDLEKPLADVASAADLVPDFTAGQTDTTNAILAYVSNAERAFRELEESQKRIARLESDLGGASKESLSLKSQLAYEANIEAKFKQVNKLFTREEADVFRQGNNVILRLVGLNFPSGKATIETKNYELLGKVQKAIALFPDSSTTVEGHTDAYGGDALNLKLSEDRANAVKEYLTVNMGLLSSKTKAVGYGETRPVANNETPEGRMKNRRIDLVIHPLF